MKRRHIIEDYELSSDDDVWEKHPFSFSGALKPAKSPSSSCAPPPIESFAFSKADVSNPQTHLENGENNGNFLHVIDVSSEDEKVTAKKTYENLEDDDVDLEAARNRGKKSGTSGLPNRNRRLIVEEDDDDEEELDGSENDEELWGKQEENDVIMNALRKCGEISAELKKELYGTAGADFYTYSEVENSSVRIVNQEDVNDACSDADSEFQPLLKPYQLVGVNFLLLLYRKKIGGAILADEMGLGKTIQAITYLTLLNHLEDDPGPHLIVCPASVLENWERELKKWCPCFTVLQFHGTARSIYAKELSSLSKSGMPPPFNVILVCYSLFERRSAQQKDDRKILKNWRWSCVLMDEAHALKDKNSYRWKNLMSVARNAKQRLMLTGTPLQNRLHELWSMLEFMMPDLFATGDVDLRKLLSAEDRSLISQIKSILGPFILRRLKSDVMQQLVPKIQKIEFVTMGEHQEDAYKQAIQKYRAAVQARMSKPSDTGFNSIAGSLPQRQISNYFFEFRKIANHPLLVRRIYTDADVVQVAKILHPKGVFGFECTLDRVIEELKNYNDFSLHRIHIDKGYLESLGEVYGQELISTSWSAKPNYSEISKLHQHLLFNDDSNATRTLSDEHVMASAKCRALYKLLPVLKYEGHRVLIFSQWTSMLDILEWTLDVIGVTYRRLDGSTNVTERQTIVDTFNKDSSIFACLLSTRAGGQGLNLTGADTVIIHDMDFNPQIDRQAEDRCHRIGQTKPVTVYRMVTKDTVDENVYQVAQRKLTLDAAVLESGVEVTNGVASDKTMGEILSSLLRG